MDNLFEKDELFKHLKLVFFITFLLGCILIFLMAYQAKKPVYCVISVSVLIILYGIYIWRRKKTPYASEADPDTLYYLGFIFTLVTLVASFLPFLSEQYKPSVERVLGIFGLGLVTTFMGLAGRIFLSQFQAEPEKIIDASMERLASSIDTFTFKLDHFTRDIEDSNSKFSASYKDLAGEIINVSTDFRDKMQNISSDTAQSIEKITVNAVQVLKTTLHEFTEGIKSINIPIDKIKESLNEPVTELAEAMKKTSKTVGTFDRKFITTSESLDKIIEKHNNLANVSTEIYNKYIEKATGVLTGFETATKNINGLTDGLDKVSDAIKLLETFTSTLPTIITATTQGGEQLKQTITATTETITSLNDKINKFLSGSFDKTIEKYNDIDKELTEIYNKFIKRISDIFGGFEIATKNINGLNEGLDKISDAIKLLEASSLPSTIKYIEQLKQTINTTAETITGFNSQVNNSLDLHKQYNESFTKFISHVNELNLKRKQGFFNKIFGR
jgi:methyl-accepting chemotaxis protein